MKQTFAALALATGLALGFGGPSASAQTSAVGTMELGLSMLELSVQRELNRLGYTDVDVSQLTLNEISRLHLILTEDESLPQQRQKVETVLEGRSAVIQ